MSPALASVTCAIGILALFALDRDQELRTSKALWIPVLWLWIVASRPVSLWLNLQTLAEPGSLAQSSQQYAEGSPLDRIVFQALMAAALLVLVTRSRQVGRLL